jgi:hypothetical protein
MNMGKRSVRLKLLFKADDVNAALDAALKNGPLCGPCSHTMSTQDEMSQSDFCFACQEVVKGQLGYLVERRMKDMLVQMGLRPDSLQITKN